MKDKENLVINDLIFKELIKRGYSVEGSKKSWNIADSKLWYLTSEQAQAFLDLEASKDYQRDLIKKEIDLIQKNRGEIISKLGKENLNVIDLGCGDGKKALIFIEELKGILKLRYCPVDISSYMVEKAITKIRSTDSAEVVEFQWNISDFENIENISILLKQGDFKRNLFLLLGNTLGNFEINELLYEVRSSMNEGDFLLIGNGLDNRESKEILKAYSNRYLDNLLIKTLTQIGLKKENLKYSARFKNSRIEMYYEIKKDAEISFLGKKVEFKKGDEIIVAVSYKYNQEDFVSFLNLYFDEIRVNISEDRSYALALCKK
tara:strand:+ start:206 stop:1162 length:957 start_codon:yes stop_codon:yes gene_type:complete